MKHILLTLCLLTWPALTQAACYADYKAKRDDPLRLHYGVARIDGGCTPDMARKELVPRLAQHRWTLLTIVSVFDDSGLAERKDSAGRHFLAY
ncbi:MAG: hypothetical protein ACPG7W_09265 [Paracoccaceae bacterium]